MKFIVILVFYVTCIEGYIFYEQGVSKEDIETIVNKHNDLRKLIATGQVPGQPRGVNLKKLVWDDDLAVAAQNISDSCIFEHQTVKDDRWSVGQNLYMSMSSAYQSGTDWDAAIQAWFNEYVNFNYSVGSFSGAGHYTQVVWANTACVGCGYTCYKDDDSAYWYNKYYVCNYGPAGNIVGQKPYEVGDSGCEDLC